MHMMNFLGALLNPPGLTPHGFCLIWQPGLIWLDAISDGVTMLAYYTIPLALLRFAKLRPNIAYRWLLYVFAAFILACGTTHLMDIYTLWVPAYGLEGLIKAITALLSIATAALLWPLIPKAASLPSPEQLREVNQALRASQGFLRRTGHVAGVGGWEIDLKTQAVLWSDQTYELHGLSPSHRPTVQETVQYYKAEARPKIMNSLSEGIELGKPFDLELPMVSAEGREFWARVVGATEIEMGKPVRVVGALQDISRYKAIEQELADERALLELTLEAIGAAVGDGVITTDLEGRVRWLNSVAEQLTGWHKAEATGADIADVFVALDEHSRVMVANSATLCLARGVGAERAEDKVLVSRDGREQKIEDSAAPMRDSRGDMIGAVLVFRDISERIRLYEEISYQATHDPLTGLPNRAKFESTLTGLLAMATTDRSIHSVLYVDLDQFKIINDSCGHTAGDVMLKQVSAMLRNNVRANDIVARLGGDEFGIILVKCAAGPALTMALSICRHLEQHRFVHAGQRFQVGASIGLVQVDAHWPNAGAVLQAADASCYEAKDAGRNRVHVWRQADQSSGPYSQEMQWISRLSQAVDDNRFELFGQFIQSIAPGPAGLQFEILLRLNEPDGSVRLPGLFMPISERFRLATRIDKWVTEHVFEWLEAASDARDAIDTIFINVSGQSVGDRAFHHQVLGMIKGATFDPRKVCFEITETAAIVNLADAAAFIDDVRALGVKMALDDFGAGSSSFSHLKTLAVDFLKIDGQFILHMLEDELDNVAVRCFRDVAKIRGVKTIAEFVEREDVKVALAEMQIDMIQGYLVHRPEPLKNLFPQVIT